MVVLPYCNVNLYVCVYYKYFAGNCVCGCVSLGVKIISGRKISDFIVLVPNNFLGKLRYF
jgi:hypothetical protein